MHTSKGRLAWSFWLAIGAVANIPMVHAGFLNAESLECMQLSVEILFVTLLERSDAHVERLFGQLHSCRSR